jgi:small glutamine-rich tetratricopeptide repeat-containing protein alpha
MQAEGLSHDSPAYNPEPSEADKNTAEKLKNDGNELMKVSNFEAAVQKYTEAIKLVKSAVFFCNRAAAYSKLEQHDLSIQDCRAALALDPQYAKAYGRMGLALSAQSRYTEAVDAYRTAVELDPTNETYKSNLEIAESKVAEQQRNMGAQGANPFASMFGGAGGGGGAGGFDLGGMLNNPAMVNMAAQMMSDPNMQQLMGNLMSGMMTQPGGQQGLGGLLQAGQHLAAQMQNANPDLVNQLRSQFQGGQGSGGQGGDGSTKPPDAPPKPDGGAGST